jgi:hypothetical protein
VDTPTTGWRPGVVPDTTVVEGVPPPLDDAAMVTSRTPLISVSVIVTFCPAFKVAATREEGASR